MSSDVLCIRRYSHCHRIHNPIVLLSIELPICNIQWKKSAQSESAVLPTTGGEDNQFCGVGDAQAFDCGPHTKDKRWECLLVYKCSTGCECLVEVFSGHTCRMCMYPELNVILYKLVLHMQCTQTCCWLTYRCSICYTLSDACVVPPDGCAFF